MKKVYGVLDLTDWVAQIPVGRATMRVQFAGGALTSYGVTPAEYATDNRFIQTAIEQSIYYKEGRIKLLYTIGQPAEDEQRASERSPETTQSLEFLEDVDESPDGDEVQEQDEQKAQGLMPVAANCLQDAQDYLQDNFGIKSYKVRTKADAQRLASENGIVFTGPGFDD